VKRYVSLFVFLVLGVGAAGAATVTPKATTLTASPPNTVVIAPSVSLITDAAGNTWGINATAPCTATWAPKGDVAEVTVNGVLDATSCQVVEIAYVNGLIWQKNSQGNWYSKASPTAAWGAGTATSPLPTYAAQVVLTWAAPIDYTNGAVIAAPLTYNVYRGASATTLLKLTNVTGLTYTDVAGSATPTTYFYAVTAICAGCTESADSGIISATLAAASLTPAAPTSLVGK
jgi:hypothetical protein